MSKRTKSRLARRHARMEKKAERARKRAVPARPLYVMEEMISAMVHTTREAWSRCEAWYTRRVAVIVGCHAFPVDPLTGISPEIDISAECSKRIVQVVADEKGNNSALVFIGNDDEFLWVHERDIDMLAKM